MSPLLKNCRKQIARLPLLWDIQYNTNTHTHTVWQNVIYYADDNNIGFVVYCYKQKISTYNRCELLIFICTNMKGITHKCKSNGLNLRLCNTLKTFCAFLQQNHFKALKIQSFSILCRENSPGVPLEMAIKAESVPPEPHRTNYYHSPWSRERGKENLISCFVNESGGSFASGVFYNLIFFMAGDVVFTGCNEHFLMRVLLLQICIWPHLIIFIL